MGAPLDFNVLQIIEITEDTYISLVSFLIVKVYRHEPETLPQLVFNGFQVCFLRLLVGGEGVS